MCNESRHEILGSFAQLGTKKLGKKLRARVMAYFFFSIKLWLRSGLCCKLLINPFTIPLREKWLKSDATQYEISCFSLFFKYLYIYFFIRFLFCNPLDNFSTLSWSFFNEFLPRCPYFIRFRWWLKSKCFQNRCFPRSSKWKRTKRFQKNSDASIEFHKIFEKPRFHVKNFFFLFYRN